MGENFSTPEFPPENQPPKEDEKTLEQMSEKDLFEERRRLREGKNMFDLPSDEEAKILTELDRRRREKMTEIGKRGAEKRKKIAQESELGQDKKEKASAKRYMPTEKQMAFLAQFGIATANATKAAASRMIEFVSRGSIADYGAEDRTGRANLLKWYKKKWEDKKVRLLATGETGMVECVIPRTAEEVKHIRETNK